MSFDDIAARLRARQSASGNHASPPNFEELYLLRARILGVLIRDARTAAGLDVDELAAQVGVSPDLLAAWEYGQSLPSLAQVELLSYALEVPVNHFWGSDLLQQARQRRPVDPHEYTLLRDRLIGAQLRAAREAAGLTPEQLAEQAGVAPGNIAAYEWGQRPIPLPVLVTLAAACGVGLAHFLEHGNRVGEYLALQADLERFHALPEDVRAFVSTPSNQPYLELAMRLARMDSDSLRAIAEAILEITL